MENVPETIEMGLCEQTNTMYPAEELNKLDIMVATENLGLYYRDIVEAEDADAIARYHEYVQKYPFLLNK